MDLFVCGCEQEQPLGIPERLREGAFGVGEAGLRSLAWDQVVTVTPGE